MVKLLLGCLAAGLLWPGVARAQGSATSSLRFEISDAAGQPLACRIHLSEASAKPVFAPGQPAWRDHFVCPGKAELDLPPGKYRYEIERGPEHERLAGEIEIEAARDRTISAALGRIADLPSLGWYSGDLHVHRPPRDVPLLMQAEDLHVAPVITWWNQTNPWTPKNLPDDPLRRADPRRFFHVLAGEDERGGGALLYFHLPRPLQIAEAQREYPSSVAFLREAKASHPDCWVDAEKPFWWDFPLWLATGQVDSIGIANNHMCRSEMLANEAWGKPRDADRLPAPLGTGYWSQAIYYHALNCGLRLPPSAGSASGVLPNPVGYNRVYVHTGDGDRLEYNDWWENLRAGRCFVTNGPLVLVRANGELPGHEFPGTPQFEITLDIELISLDRVPRIEVVQNGDVVRTIDCRESLQQRLTVTFPSEPSGWFLVRAIADNPQTFRFASTGPFYIGRPDQPRISRRSAQFFLDWTNERAARLEASLTDASQRRQVLEDVDSALRFWKLRLEKANAE
jgi:hypothetical protein